MPGGGVGVQSGAGERLTVAVPVLLAIALGGALGSLGRWTLEELMGTSTASGWPWGTLTANVVGALLIGIIATSGLIEGRPAWVRPFLITGILGGFTTFSALALETSVMLETGRQLAALAYVGVTLAAGLLAVQVGRAVMPGGRR